MLAYIYATGLFLFTMFKNRVKRSGGSLTTDNNINNDLADRISTLEHGFVFLDRDINNGLMGGTSVSTNNRVIDGMSNPIFESRTVLRGFIGNNSDIWFTAKKIPSHLSVNWVFSARHASVVSLTAEPKFIHLVSSRNWQRFRQYTYSKIYKTEIYEALYNNREHPREGSPIEREGSYRCDTFWRYDQLIVSRREMISNCLCFIAYMKHNIDFLDVPVTFLDAGSTAISLKLDRERTNTLVICDVSCVIVEAYLMCGFTTVELSKTHFRRASDYSYLDINLTDIKAKEGDAYAIIRVKCSKICKVFHQLGGV